MAGFDNDPVGSGHVASLARPGENITGLSTLSPEVSGKQLELLGEVAPGLSRVGVLGTSTQPGYGQVAKEIEIAAGALGVKLQILDVLSPKDIERLHSEMQARGTLKQSSPGASECCRRSPPDTGCGSRRKEAAAGDISTLSRICRGRRAYVLRCAG